MTVPFFETRNTGIQSLREMKRRNIVSLILNMQNVRQLGDAKRDIKEVVGYANVELRENLG
jgi:hypothetical protein